MRIANTRSCLVIEQFPLLLSCTSKKERLAEIIQTINAAIEVGEIRNPVFNQVRNALSSIISLGWKRHVGYRFILGKQHCSQKIENIYYSLRGLRDVLVIHGKLATVCDAEATASAMKEFIQEVLPLADTLESLRDKVVKGKSGKRSTTTVSGNLVKTCPCCFRAVAVRQGQGVMLPHGYRRPGRGWLMIDCPGVRFPPLELSNAGLIWLIKNKRAQLAACHDDYENRNKKNFLLIRGNNIKKDSVEWEKEVEMYIQKIRYEIRGLTCEIAILEKRLREWCMEKP